MDMSHHSHDMGADNGHTGHSSAVNCKLDMLWNWNVVDSCFIFQSLRITSRSMFTGTCVAVVFLGMLPEFARRLGREHDRILINSQREINEESSIRSPIKSRSSLPSLMSSDLKSSMMPFVPLNAQSRSNELISYSRPIEPLKFRPNTFQQAIRSFLYLLQFGLSYILMLLAMYYNGYMIICIMLGAFLGHFMFSWEKLHVPSMVSSNQIHYC